MSFQPILDLHAARNLRIALNDHNFNLRGTRESYYKNESDERLKLYIFTLVPSLFSESSLCSTNDDKNCRIDQKKFLFSRKPDARTYRMLNLRFILKVGLDVLK